MNHAPLKAKPTVRAVVPFTFYIFHFTFLAVILISCGIRRDVKPPPHAAGFKIIQSVDRSRIYKPHSATSDKLHFRPLDIDIWYPATSASNDTVLRFQDLLGLLEQRANYYTASNAADGLTNQLAVSFVNGFTCGDSISLLHFKTSSIRNAAAVKNKFPVVIYMCAYNGMSFENYRLFETLASKGMIVVAISSIGRYPGDMTMSEADLLEQVGDARAAIQVLKQDPHVDHNRMAIVGYSWGGLAGTILAQRLQDIKCIVSLDGSEFHHYGYSKEDDADFESIRTGKEFRNLLLTVPYMRLESAGDPGKHDSVYNFLQKLGAESQVYSIDSAKHEDFGSLSLVVPEAGKCPGDRKHQLVIDLTTAFLQDVFQQQDEFHALTTQPGIKARKN